MAGGPVSRILSARVLNAADAPGRSFLWAAHRYAAQAAYPRVITGRASPPLLFGLAPRVVCRAPNVAVRAVGSYPTFSPLPATEACEDEPKVLPSACHRNVRAGGLFSVALSVAEPSRTRPPGVTRRAALQSEALRPRTAVSGLSSSPRGGSRPDEERRDAHDADQRSPGPPAVSIIRGDATCEIGASGRRLRRGW